MSADDVLGNQFVSRRVQQLKQEGRSLVRPTLDERAASKARHPSQSPILRPVSDPEAAQVRAKEAAARRELEKQKLRSALAPKTPQRSKHLRAVE